MYTLGIDLAVRGQHKAVVLDEKGHQVTPLIAFTTSPAALTRLLDQARGERPEVPLRAVMEPTGMAWFPVAVFLIRHGVTVYLVNALQVADLRRYFKKHAKSDRIDAHLLAKLPLVDESKLHPLQLHGAQALACQRGCKEVARLSRQATAIKNRLLALDRFAWPGLESQVFSDPFGPAARWFRQHWYHPARVLAAGESGLRQAWLQTHPHAKDQASWTRPLVALAQQVMELYGAEGAYLDFDWLQAEARREQQALIFVEAQARQVRQQVVRPLYRALHPSRHLETIPGVGEDSAAVFVSFIGHPERFPTLRQWRGWTGMVPYSHQSSQDEVKGLKLTQAGPRLIRHYAYLDAEVARRYDPQIAAIYYDQVVNKGRHHTQAVCACATHLLNRVLTVLREDRPYELRDIDGTPVTPAQARRIIAERYRVPPQVRQRRNHRAPQGQAKKKGKRRSGENPAG
jgi:transposase